MATSLFGSGPERSEYLQRASEADEAGEKFCQIFYETLDKRRQLITGFYSEESVVVWNGNNVVGASNITSLYQSFPGSEHTVHCLDCQPVATGDSQRTVLVACQGVVKYDDTNSVRSFSHNFILSKQGEVWKVASDCFRFLDK